MTAPYMLALALLAWPALISASPVVSSEVTEVNEVTEAPLPEVVVRLVSREQSQSPLRDHAALPAQQDLQSRKKKSPYCVQVHSDHPDEPAYEVCGQKVPVEPHSHSDAVHNLANAAIASASAPTYGHQTSSYGTAPQAQSYGAAPQAQSYGAAPQPQSYGTPTHSAPSYGPVSYGTPSHQAPSYGTSSYGTPHQAPSYGPASYGTPSHQALSYGPSSYNTAPQTSNYGTPHQASSYGTPSYGAHPASSYGGVPSYIVSHAVAPVPHSYAPPSHLASGYAAPAYPAASSYAAPKPTATYFPSGQVPHAAYAGTYQPIASSHSSGAYNAPVSSASVSDYKDNRISLMPSYGTQKMRAPEDTKDKNETRARASEYDSSHEHSDDCKFPLKFVGYISPAPKSDSHEEAPAYEPAAVYDDSKPTSAAVDVEYPPKLPVNYAPYGNKGYGAPYMKPLYPSYRPPPYTYQPKVPVYVPQPPPPPPYIYSTPYISYPAPAPMYGPEYYKPATIPVSVACHVIPTPPGPGYTQPDGYGRNAAPVYTCVIQDKPPYDPSVKDNDDKKPEPTVQESTNSDPKSSEESNEKQSGTVNNQNVTETSTQKLQPKADEGKPPRKPQESIHQTPIQRPSGARSQVFPPPPFPQYGPEYYPMNHGRGHPAQKMK